MAYSFLFLLKHPRPRPHYPRAEVYPAYIFFINPLSIPRIKLVKVYAVVHKQDYLRYINGIIPVYVKTSAYIIPYPIGASNLQLFAKALLVGLADSLVCLVQGVGSGGADTLIFCILKSECS